MVSKTMLRIQERLEGLLNLLTPITGMGERLERIEQKLDQLAAAQPASDAVDKRMAQLLREENRHVTAAPKGRAADTKG
jgi:hypothetical protein